jgi:ureidoacrylate peracid hydrolase
MSYYVTPENLKQKTSEWLKKIKPYKQHDLKINKSKSALMVVDMQKFFLEPSSPTFTCGGLAILPNIIKLVSAFRKAKRPVIYTKHVHHPDKIDAGIMGWWWEGMCIEGSPESEIHEQLKPLPNEKIILKHRYSAFYNTDLETVLRCMKIEDLVVAGIMTNMCCESTARDAYYRDYRVFFPANGTGSTDEEMHLASLINLAYGFACVNTAEKILEDMR